MELVLRRNAVSLFSGAGGMDIGFHDADVEIVWANDIDPDACKTYETNISPKIHNGDLLDHLDSLSKFHGVDLVFGGPPCQGFSVAGRMDPGDPRSQHIWSFKEAVKIIRPKAFVMENVKALATLARWRHVRRELREEFRSLGYGVEIIVLKASDFGVPQVRERMFMLGVKGDFDVFDFEILTNSFKHEAPTVREVLKELGVAGSQSNSRTVKAKVTLAKSPVLRKSPYAGMLFNGQGRPLNPEGQCSTLPATMGGNRTPIIDENHLFLGKESWVEKYHAHLLSGGSPYPSDSAPQCLRRLTVDEAIRLQTFPYDYDFVGRQSSIFRQIGNAVPCKLANAVANAVVGYLDGNRANSDTLFQSFG